MRPIHIDPRFLALPFIIPTSAQTCQLVFNTASVNWVRAVGFLATLAVIGWVFRLFLVVHKHQLREQELWDRREAAEAERERAREEKTRSLAKALSTPPAERTEEQRNQIRRYRAVERALELEQAALGIASVREQRAKRAEERRRHDAEIARLAKVPGALSPDKPRRVR